MISVATLLILAPLLLVVVPLVLGIVILLGAKIELQVNVWAMLVGVVVGIIPAGAALFQHTVLAAFIGLVYLAVEIAPRIFSATHPLRLRTLRDGAELGLFAGACVSAIAGIVALIPV